MYSDEEIFVYDIDSLKNISKNPTDRNLLSASGILRRLLTDNGGPLLHKVARGRDFKPRFRVLHSDGLESAVKALPGLKFSWRTPDTSSFPKAPTLELGLDEFLRYRLVFMAGKDITVLQMINYVANVGGGVHQGKPGNKHNAEIIHETANTLQIYGIPYPLASLSPIINIVVEALMPLYDRVRA